jgi:hypothetical protein
VSRRARSGPGARGSHVPPAGARSGPPAPGGASSNTRPEAARRSADPPGDEVVHRGVRWHRDGAGQLQWYNEGLGQWARWYPGADAPPLPAGWEPADGPATVKGARERPGLLRYLPEGAMARRRPMTSPYRWVPLLIAVAIVAVAVYQATRPPARASRQDISAARALAGKCLASQGGGAYSPTPVSCGSAGAAVKVVAVVLPSREVSCPKGTLVAQVSRPGVVGEPFECLLPLQKR